MLKTIISSNKHKISYLLTSSNPKLKERALDLIEQGRVQIKKKTATLLMQSFMSGDLKWRIRVAIALSIAANKSCTEGLLKVLKDRNPSVRGYACEALGRIKEFRTIHALKQAASDSNADVRHSAIFALASFPKHISLAYAKTLLKDKSPLVRLAVMILISSIIKAQPLSRQNACRVLEKHACIEHDGLVLCDLYAAGYFLKNSNSLANIISLTKSHRGIVRWRSYSTLIEIVKGCDVKIALKTLKNRLKYESSDGIRKLLKDGIKKLSKKVSKMIKL